MGLRWASAVLFALLVGACGPAPSPTSAVYSDALGQLLPYARTLVTPDLFTADSFKGVSAALYTPPNDARGTSDAYCILLEPFTCFVGYYTHESTEALVSRFRAALAARYPLVSASPRASGDPVATVGVESVSGTFAIQIQEADREAGLVRLVIIWVSEDFVPATPTPSGP